MGLTILLRPCPTPRDDLKHLCTWKMHEMQLMMSSKVKTAKMRGSHTVLSLVSKEPSCVRG